MKLNIFHTISSGGCLCQSDVLSEICGMLFFFFFLLLQRGRVEVIEEIKEARREGGAQSGGSYICVRDPSFLNIFSPGHFDNLEGKRGWKNVLLT